MQVGLGVRGEHPVDERARTLQIAALEGEAREVVGRGDAEASLGLGRDDLGQQLLGARVVAVAHGDLGERVGGGGRKRGGGGGVGIGHGHGHGHGHGIRRGRGRGRARGRGRRG
jgi:hypothetical protein